MEKNNVLLMPFIDSSESFTNGFECGQIWEKISQGENLENYLCHDENKEQIIMICESFGVGYEFTDKNSQIISITSPRSVNPNITGLSKDGGNTQFTKEAITINDNENLTSTEREQKIKEHFLTIGVEVVFEGEYIS